MNRSALDAVLCLHPGRPLPTISGSRAEWVPRLTAGRAAQGLPTLLGSLFTLCASTHRLAARHAVAAAQGAAAPATADELRALQLSQVREQILRITLDWPRQLPRGAADGEPALLLRACPLWRNELDAESQLQALPAWLEHRWLGMAPSRWLHQHEVDPKAWAATWCQSSRGPVANLLRSQVADAPALATAADPLDLLRDPELTMPRLAARLAGEPGFGIEPEWEGRVRDTGPWSRVNDPVPVPADSAWQRLVSRVADVAHLVAPAGEYWLAQGALTLAPGEGVAWVEMARGLLVHWVRLEGRGDAARVDTCRVLAPTEWNFHPRGLLAQALSGLREPGLADAARRLAVAFDPCVAFEVEAATEEQVHA